MIFSSITFLLFFLPFFLLVYFVADQRYKNFIAFAASLFFYSWGGPKFVFAVCISLILDFFIVQTLYKSQGTLRKILLFLSIALNLGSLIYFKYANFFVANVNSALSAFQNSPITWTEIALPIGISFFTFQKLSYTIDVYRNQHAPLKSIIDYMLYILLFPHSIAGPIIRFNEIADQIEERSEQDNVNNKFYGLLRFIIGLSKKVLIANVLGEYADKVFSAGLENIDTSIAWLGIIAYTFQIYFDFSGYSDMAIGIGRMMGFVIPENFNFPYISQNISEFWQRWHITLGRWFRDYLYFPLGGNRVSKTRNYFNLWFVFLISGLWHGSAWNFVFWGAYHGFFLICDRLFLIKILTRLGKIPSIIFNFFIVMIGWVFFRSENLTFAFRFLKKLFKFQVTQNVYLPDSKFWIILMVACIFSFLGIFVKSISFDKIFYQAHRPMYQNILITVFITVFFITCLGSIAASNFNPFIYFRF